MSGDATLPRPATPSELKSVIEAERTGEPFVLYRDAAARLEAVSLEDKAHATIGRRDSNDIALVWDAEASRAHAELELVADSWTIIDDGLSRNGTFVNGARIQGRRRLNDGDSIRVGSTLIAFRRPGAGTSAVTQQPTGAIAIGELTATQRRILVALCRPYKHRRGLALPATNQEIADELHLSVDAVKSHLRVLFAKFGVEQLRQNEKRTQLVDRALLAGVVAERDL